VVTVSVDSRVVAQGSIEVVTSVRNRPSAEQVD
jgi:hypothetical protein